MLTVINLSAAPTFDGQAVADSTDWNAATGGDNGTFVSSGCVVTQDTGADMKVAVAAGVVYIAGAAITVAGTGATPLVIAPADLTDRKDIVVYTVGTGLQVIKGTDCGTANWTQANSSSLSTPPPDKPAIPANSVLLAEIYVSASTTVITTAANIVDKTNVSGIAGVMIGNVNANNNSIFSLSQLLIGEASTSNIVGIEIATSGTYSGGPTYFGLHINDTATFTTVNPNLTSSPLRIDSQWDLQKYNTFSSLAALAFTPTFTTHSGQTPAFVMGANIAPQILGVPVAGGIIGMSISPLWNGTGSQGNMYGLAIGTRGGTPTGTITNYIGLDIGVDSGLPTATNTWGLRVATVQSYFNGKVTFGSNGNPVTAIDLQATGGDTGAIQFAPQASNPSNPTSSGPMKMYFKGTKVVFQFNDAGTVRYFTADLNQALGTAVWANSVTAP